MRDFRRDWRRWTRAERVFAIVLAVAVAVGVPVALANYGHAASAGASHSAGRLS